MGMDRNTRIMIAIMLAAVLSLGALAIALQAGTGTAANTPETGCVGNTSPENCNSGQGTVSGETQNISIHALSSGRYDLLEVHVKAGKPVKLAFSAEPSAGCGIQLVMPAFGINLVSRNGETVTAEFTPQKGNYAYRCGMNMFRGVLYAD